MSSTSALNKAQSYKNHMRIALMSMKGGCGKTTIATNLAAYFADKKLETVLIDYDQQGGCLHWLTQRDQLLPQIHPVDARKKAKLVTASWQETVPYNTEVSILDTPGNMDVLNIIKMVDKADIILIPVMPSTLDMRSAAHFIETLLIQGRIRQKGKKIGVIASRIQRNTNSFKILENFLNRLDIPLVARFRNLQRYIYSQEQGVGVSEFTKNRDKTEQEQWDTLASWIHETYKTIK